MLTESLVAVSADPRVELLVAQSPGPAGQSDGEDRFWITLDDGSGPGAEAP